MIASFYLQLVILYDLNYIVNRLKFLFICLLENILMIAEQPKFLKFERCLGLLIAFFFCWGGGRGGDTQIHGNSTFSPVPPFAIIF